MSGLLRRLARVAVGASVPTVHAMARLPYGPAPELLTVNEMHTAPEPAQPLAARGSPPPPAARAPLSRASRDASPPVAAAPPPREVPSEFAPPSSNACIVPAPLLPVAAPGDSRAAPDSAPAAFGADAGAHEMRDPVPAADVDANPRSIGAAPPPAAPRRGSAGTASHTVPDALLPPLAATVISPPAADLRANVSAAGASVETASEVHVHIGRIEVTAIQDAAAPKPAARNGRQPLSLDAYLARRDAKQQ